MRKQNRGPRVITANAAAGATASQAPQRVMTSNPAGATLATLHNQEHTMDATCGLGRLADHFEGIREECRRWKARALKAEADLEELRMHIHQFAACKGEPKETARSILRAEAIDYHQRIEAAARKLI